MADEIKIEDVQKQLTDTQAMLAEVTKRADRAELITKLSTKDQETFKALSIDDQEAFFKCDSKEKRDSILDEANKAEEVARKAAESTSDDDLQKTAIGREYIKLRKQNEDITKQNKSLSDRVDAAQAFAKVAEDRRVLAEFTKRAEDDFGSFPGEPTVKGGLLKAMSEKLEKAEFTAVYDLLKSGEAALRQLGTAPGRDVPAAGSDPYQQLDALARKRAADGSISYSKAFEAVTDENPKLYEAYNKSLGVRN